MIKQVICLSFAAIASLTGVVSAVAYSGGGSGTVDKPYRISTAADMNEIGANPDDWGSHFVIVNDINLADYSGTEFNIIGNDVNAFSGVFDGNDHRISNFTYTAADTDHIGLFGYVNGQNAMIKDLTLVDPNVKAVYSYSINVGCLVGRLLSGTITGCGIEGGSVTGTGCQTGGLVGSNYSGTISNCHTEGNVSGDDSIGGLVGDNAYEGTISNSYAAGIVTGTKYIGGLVGGNRGTISNCYAGGIVSGVWYSVGGLAGYNDSGKISNCYASSSVTGHHRTGGLVGTNESGRISSCYSVGEVSASGTSWQSGYSYDRYDDVVVNGTSYKCLQDHTSSSSFEDDLAACYWKLTTGGLVGYGAGAVNCFWDIETSGQLQSAGGEGQTTAEMKTASTFLGWGGCGNEEVWTIDDGNDYPRLSWQNLPGHPLPLQQLCDFLTGSGTAAAPYIVYTAEQLNLIGLFSCEWDKHFILTADIDLSGYTGTAFNIIGYYITGHSDNEPFTGVFDGNNHSIFNFTYHCEHEQAVGLFGYVEGTNAVIKNLTLSVPDVNVADYSYYVASLVGRLVSGTITGCGIEGGSVTGREYTGGLVGSNSSGTISNCHAAASVSGKYDYTGGLVGVNAEGMISNCYAAGSVSGHYDTGGLVGGNFGTISNCHADSSVTGYEWTGGLVGRNFFGTISNCYATGSVTGEEATGGLVGWSRSGTILNCYAAGRVTGTTSTGGLLGYDNSGSYTSSFWDSDVNPDVNGIGNTTYPNVIGESTVNMQIESTFTNMGWDFVDIWDICEGTNYPRFLWQIPVGDLLCPDGVNFIDYSFFAGHWRDGNCAGSNDCNGSDLDQSGTVDINDLEILADNWLAGIE